MEKKEKKTFAPNDRDRTVLPWVERAHPGNDPTDKIPEIKIKEAILGSQPQLKTS